MGDPVQHFSLVPIRHTKLNGPVRASHAAISHKAGACRDTVPWDEPKDEAQKVYRVVGLKVMWQVHCPGRVTGPGRCYGSHHKRWEWFMGLLVRRDSEKLKSYHLKHISIRR